MKPKTILITLCAGTLLAVLAATVVARRPAPAAAAGQDARTFEVFGQIRSLDVLNKTVRIAHEEVRDYMPAMVMPFAVKEAILLNGFAVNDRVKFQLTVTPDDSWISRIQKIDAAQAGESVTALAATPQGREADRVQTGEVVPDFGLINQDGQAFRLRDFRGKAVVLTFIYTRCPIPNFCPLMSKNFAELQQRLGKEFATKYQLISISMDPEFDQPDVLKEYAARYGAMGNDWSFATGNAEQVGFVAGLMGLYYARENGLISHDLRTAVISPEGRLVHLWKSNVWTPYEVQRVVRETLTGDADVAVR
jgi:protein SCO1/2